MAGGTRGSTRPVSSRISFAFRSALMNGSTPTATMCELSVPGENVIGDPEDVEFFRLPVQIDHVAQR